MKIDEIPTCNSYYHRGDGRNSMRISFKDYSFYYSYNELVAFWRRGFKLVVHENNWSRTTGAHLNAINKDKKIRVDDEEFERLFNEYFKDM